jgi:hypothetical protein
MICHAPSIIHDISKGNILLSIFIITKPIVPKNKTTILAVKSRSRTAAGRKAQSQRMKKTWAARKLVSKPAVAAKTVPAVAKRKPKTAAQKKALSLKMKQVWAKKKAAAKKA